MKRNFTPREAKCIQKDLTRVVPGGGCVWRRRECEGFGGNHVCLAAVVDHEGPVPAILGSGRGRRGPSAMDARVLYGCLLAGSGPAVRGYSVPQRILRGLLHQLSRYRY